jgi:molecular chaperone Hsp33
VSSYLLQGTAATDTLRVFACDTTALVAEARARHDTSWTATAALGRSLTASILLAQVLTKREHERITLRIQGDGPLGWIVCEGSKDGKTRGYVRFPQVELPARASDGKLDVSGLVGTVGELAVTRLLENSEPYSGSVELVSGEIGEDVAMYLASSEQINSVVMLGVHVDTQGVTHAGGILLQTMPGVTEETLHRLEVNLRQLSQLTTMMRSEGLLGAVGRLLDGLEFEAYSKTLPLEFKCYCSREKALDSLRFFGADERAEMIADGGQETVCHWCSTKYQITPDEIRELETATPESRQLDS